MERLTKMHYKSSDGHYMACSELIKCDGRCADCPYLDNMVERLAAYEDTHMMPSDVTSMRMDMAILTALFNGIDADRMLGLCAAERDGRVVVLPRKVGDTVYYRCGKRITDFEIVGFSVDKKGASIIYAEHHADENGTAYSYFFDVKKIGRTVFFTREEAERALRKEEVTE